VVRGGGRLSGVPAGRHRRGPRLLLIPSPAGVAGEAPLPATTCGDVRDEPRRHASRPRRNDPHRGATGLKTVGRDARADTLQR
jgi:hypothetical protein